MSLSTFECIPGDILNKIAVSVGVHSFLGPPTDIITMRLLSREVERNVSWSHVHADIFTHKFDIAAPLRRLGRERIYVDAQAAELIKRFKTLKRLRRPNQDLYDPETLRLDLWTAYFMFLENEGKNVKQLVAYSRVDSFALNYVSRGGLLHDGANPNSGSIVDSETNTLAASLFWLTDKYRVESETPGGRGTALQALFWPWVESDEYPSTTFPLTTFRVDAANPGIPLAPHSIHRSLRGSPGPDCTIPDYFGSTLTVTIPLISLPAYLSTVVRSMSMDGNDMSLIQAPLVEWGDEGTGTIPGSKCYDADWARLRARHGPLSEPVTREHTAFKPGTLHGKWVGRWFIQDDNDNFVLEIARGPNRMQLHIREHHQNRKDDVLGYDDISHDGVGSGLLNAWLPRNTTMVEVGNDLLVYDPNKQQSSTYHTYDPYATAGDDADEGNIPQENRGLYGGNVHDILLTAQSSLDNFEGRVRDCDGLVMLVQRSTKRRIFYGQVHGGRNIVGRWRDATTPVSHAGKSGVWCMTKVDE